MRLHMDDRRQSSSAYAENRSRNPFRDGGLNIYRETFRIFFRILWLEIERIKTFFFFRPNNT